MQQPARSEPAICAAIPVLFIKPLLLSMLAMLVDDDLPDIVVVALMVPLPKSWYWWSSIYSTKHFDCSGNIAF